MVTNFLQIVEEIEGQGGDQYEARHADTHEHSPVDGLPVPERDVGQEDNTQYKAVQQTADDGKPLDNWQRANEQEHDENADVVAELLAAVVDELPRLLELDERHRQQRGDRALGAVVRRVRRHDARALKTHDSSTALQQIASCSPWLHLSRACS